MHTHQICSEQRKLIDLLKQPLIRHLSENQQFQPSVLTALNIQNNEPVQRDNNSKSLQQSERQSYFLLQKQNKTTRKLLRITKRDPQIFRSTQIIYKKSPQDISHSIQALSQSLEFLSDYHLPQKIVQNTLATLPVKNSKEVEDIQVCNKALVQKQTPMCHEQLFNDEALRPPQHLPTQAIHVSIYKQQQQKYDMNSESNLNQYSTLEYSHCGSFHNTTHDFRLQKNSQHCNEVASNPDRLLSRTSRSNNNNNNNSHTLQSLREKNNSLKTKNLPLMHILKNKSYCNARQIEQRSQKLQKYTEEVNRSNEDTSNDHFDTSQQKKLCVVVKPFQYAEKQQKNSLCYKNQIINTTQLNETDQSLIQDSKTTERVFGASPRRFSQLKQYFQDKYERYQKNDDVHQKQKSNKYDARSTQQQWILRTGQAFKTTHQRNQIAEICKKRIVLPKQTVRDYLNSGTNLSSEIDFDEKTENKTVGKFQRQKKNIKFSETFLNVHDTDSVTLESLAQPDSIGSKSKKKLPKQKNEQERLGKNNLTMRIVSQFELSAWDENQDVLDEEDLVQ